MTSWLSLKRVKFCFSSVTHATATATAIIAIVTTVYAVVSFLQWRALNRANDINAENIYEIQRPFINISRMQATAIFSGTPPTITIVRLNPVVENAGNTPAKSLVIRMNYDDVRDPLTNDYRFPDLDGVIRYPAVGGPRSLIPVPDKAFDRSLINEIISGARFLYIYGSAAYKDRFVGTPEHFTLFCFQVTGSGPPIGATPTGGINTAPATSITLNFPACQRHNCTDEECRDEGFIK